MEICECDLVDVQNFSKFNDKLKDLLTVIDDFSKFLHIISLMSKKCKAVASAFQLIFKNSKYNKPLQKYPICVRADKGNEFLNKSFHEMLKFVGIHFQVRRNPDVIWSVIERTHRTTRVNYTRILSIRTCTELTTLFPNLSRLTKTRFTVQLSWRHHK
jgi:hypothetical protein